MKNISHHRTIVGACCCHHWLGRPALGLRLVLRRIPLHASVRNEEFWLRFIFNACKRRTYFIDDDALLLMVKFSAREASELSKSPVRTLPGCCGWPAPGIICGCEACIEPVVEFKVPADPTGFSTSPKGSNPLWFSCLVRGMCECFVWMWKGFFVIIIPRCRIFEPDPMKWRISEWNYAIDSIDKKGKNDKKWKEKIKKKLLLITYLFDESALIAICNNQRNMQHKTVKVKLVKGKAAARHRWPG